MSESYASLSGKTAKTLIDITDDLSCLDSDGSWLVLGYFEGPILAAKFETWSDAKAPRGTWRGTSSWQSHTSQAQYETAVEETRQRIAAGDVYQTNVCRLLSAPWPDDSSIAGLHTLLQMHNPAPMSAVVELHDRRLKKWGFDSIEIASASPEIFLSRRVRVISSSPIKGTAPIGSNFLAKDNSENIMIVDLVRNDLSRVCDVASIEVPHLLQQQEHPGLVHLVSTIQGNLRPDVTWNEIFSASFPPGSVTGAPKSSAVSLIQELEEPRGIYCGTIGIVDADRQTADLSVAIRTFWRNDNRVWFGTGAGITWGSDPRGEWEETELKARHLCSVANLTLDVEISA